MIQIFKLFLIKQNNPYLNNLLFPNYYHLVVYYYFLVPQSFSI